tara:strand:+ start:248 stop:595 length:348 start_codon:yes stop_codon:yes gene_type:complete
MELEDIQNMIRALPTYQNIKLHEFVMYARELVWMQRQWMSHKDKPKDEMSISYLDRTLSIERVDSANWNLICRNKDLQYQLMFSMPLYTNEITPERQITNAAITLYTSIQEKERS